MDVQNVLKLLKKIDGTLTYSTKRGILITDNDFNLRKYPKHHLSQYLSSKSALENLAISMVTQITLDPMHLIDLGVTRKFLLRIFNKKTVFKTPIDNLKAISSKLLDMRNHVTKEFARKPRSLDDLVHWKATEFRQFVLYSGIIALKNSVHDDVYYEFLLLHCAYRLLCSPKQCKSNIETSQTLLDLFVENFPIVFGENSVSYNVHSLLHLKHTIGLVGNIATGSAYGFENYLQKLKKVVRKPTLVLQQIYKNILGDRFVSDTHPTGPRVSDSNMTCIFRNCILSIKSPDNICFVKNSIPIQIQQFTADSVIGRRFINIRSFYEEPCDSKTLGIYVVDIEASDKIETFDLEDLECKALCIPYKHDLVLMPILHSCH